jgi:hypothetical protein
MFALVDTTPAQNAAPCKACSLLIEIGPPPMSDDVHPQELVSSHVKCKHHLAQANNFPEIVAFTQKKSFA